MDMQSGVKWNAVEVDLFLEDALQARGWSRHIANSANPEGRSGPSHWRVVHGLGIGCGGRRCRLPSWGPMRHPRGEARCKGDQFHCCKHYLFLTTFMATGARNLRICGAATIPGYLSLITSFTGIFHVCFVHGPRSLYN
ncbi:hypothetical protein BO71DRAFT_227818 [Aspergillus ellipticus CBS 707.79]|uniref:Uncharacterized protein n=1 Tax=Aspergillus ellipticus CBS 707.79 TaxID=1448320 RepID=A0A319E1T2_9EURO|nr:hypothetical protein BO71DRAFT_227818 [Aspergillus ellipticus CBS 707.79]